MLSLLTGCNSAGLLVVNLLAGFDNYHVYENLSYGPEKQNVMDVYVPETKKMSGQPDRRPVVVFFMVDAGAVVKR
jgi:hypothetical protein